MDACVELTTANCRKYFLESLNIFSLKIAIINVQPHFAALK